MSHSYSSTLVRRANVATLSKKKAKLAGELDRIFSKTLNLVVSSSSDREWSSLSKSGECRISRRSVAGSAIRMFRGEQTFRTPHSPSEFVEFVQTCLFTDRSLLRTLLPSYRYYEPVFHFPYWKCDAHVIHYRFSHSTKLVRDREFVIVQGMRQERESEDVVETVGRRTRWILCAGSIEGLERDNELEMALPKEGGRVVAASLGLLAWIVEKESGSEMMRVVCAMHVLPHGYIAPPRELSFLFSLSPHRNETVYNLTMQKQVLRVLRYIKAFQINASLRARRLMVSEKDPEECEGEAISNDSWIWVGKETSCEEDERLRFLLEEVDSLELFDLVLRHASGTIRSWLVLFLDSGFSGRLQDQLAEKTVEIDLGGEIDFENSIDEEKLLRLMLGVRTRLFLYPDLLNYYRFFHVCGLKNHAFLICRLLSSIKKTSILVRCLMEARKIIPTSPFFVELCNRLKEGAHWDRISKSANPTIAKLLESLRDIRIKSIRDHAWLRELIRPLASFEELAQSSLLRVYQDGVSHPNLTLTCEFEGQQTTKCHRQVLLWRSNFFFRMLHFGGREKDEVVDSDSSLQIDVLNFDCLECLVQHAYTDSMSLPDVSATNNMMILLYLLRHASLFREPGLRSLVERKLGVAFREEDCDQFSLESTLLNTAFVLDDAPDDVLEAIATRLLPEDFGGRTKLSSLVDASIERNRTSLQQERFELEVARRFVGLEGRLTGVEDRLSGMEAALEEMKSLLLENRFPKFDIEEEEGEG